MNSPHLRLIATLAAVAGGGVLLLGQQPSSSAQQPLPTFRSSAEAVQLTVIVTDASGNPVPDLTEADFEILENGAPQPITTFSAVNIPIERSERSLAESDVLSNDGPPGRDLCHRDRRHPAGAGATSEAAAPAVHRGILRTERPGRRRRDDEWPRRQRTSDKNSRATDGCC